MGNNVKGVERKRGNEVRVEEEQRGGVVVEKEGDYGGGGVVSSTNRSLPSLSYTDASKTSLS